MADPNVYSTPFEARYASKEMLYLFSDNFKFRTWRRLWIALAEEEKALGIAITDEQIDDLKAHAEDIDYAFAAKKEKELRHDVMAHIHAYGEVAKTARPIIHLGATSAFVGDNTDLIQIREALILIRKKLFNVIAKLADRATETKDIVTLAFTHFQPAQPTTVGKRFTLWLQDLVDDFYEIEALLSGMRFRGAKGTTGTQASFMTLFDGDEEKINALDAALAKRFGFSARYHVTGQTYPRRFDSAVGKTLALFAEDMHKIATDIRLLQSMKEVEEPFEKSQVGSSAMAYKRNPMRSERVCSLARFAVGLSHALSFTAATQWFERTLDDSANKRLSIPQLFLSVDAMLEIALNVFPGLVVNEKIIEKNLARELPFMATEAILMRAAQKGGDRQTAHEAIRELSQKAGYEIKREGGDNRLIEYIERDPRIGLSRAEIEETLCANAFAGRASSQTKEFIERVIVPLKNEYAFLTDERGGELSV